MRDSAAANPTPAGRGEMRLLIVEDDREAAEYLRKALREAGHMAELARDGEEGLALAQGGDFDVLVVDRAGPGENCDLARLTGPTVGLAARRG